jgi:hypothetical protein
MLCPDNVGSSIHKNSEIGSPGARLLLVCDSIAFFSCPTRRAFQGGDRPPGLFLDQGERRDGGRIKKMGIMKIDSWQDYPKEQLKKIRTLMRILNQY